MGQSVTKIDLARVQANLEKKVQKVGTDLKKLRLDMVVMGKRLEWKFDEKIEELAEKISGLPTKDEFYAKMDEVMGELKTIREEQTIGGHQISGHEDRIGNLENIHPQGQHQPIL